MSRTTIYRRWPDLGSLMCDVFDELVHDESTVDLDGADTTTQALHMYLVDYARRLNDDGYLAVLVALIDGASRDADFAAIHQKSFQDTRSRAADIIRRGRKDGTFYSSLDVRQGVEDIVSPFPYRRLVGQQRISAKAVDELHGVLLKRFAEPLA